jgi:hypothetical protein
MEYRIDRKSLQKIALEFRNVASRLISSRIEDSTANLRRFIALIDNNPLIFDFVNQYATLPEVASYELKQAQRGTWNIPIEKPQEIGCTYVLLKHAVTEEWDYRKLALGYSHSSKYQDQIDMFNKSVVQPFVGYIVEYLQGLMIDAGMSETDTTTVHISAGANYFAGDVHGSMLAIGGSSISESSINNEAPVDLARIMESLRDDLSEVLPKQKLQVEEAIDVLVRSASGEEVSRIALAQSVEVIGKSSPSMRAKLENVAANALGGLASHGIIAAIQFVYGLASRM